MNMVDFQNRVNAIVQRVNEYENGLEKEQGDETKLLSEHKFCDIHCLRAVYDWITGCDETRKTNTTLNSTVNGRLYSFDTYHSMNSTSFTDFSFQKIYYNTGNLNAANSFNLQDANNSNATGWSGISVGRDDVMGLYNLAYAGGGYYTGSTSSPPTRTSYIFNPTSIGFTIASGVNIADALITESQVVNLMDVDYIFDYSNSNMVTPAKIMDNSTASTLNYCGIYLHSNRTSNSIGSPIYLLDSQNYSDIRYITLLPFGQQGESDMGNNFQLKLFLADSDGAWTARASTRYGFKFGILYSSSSSSGYRRNSNPAQQTYFELAFKRRRAGCKAAGLDFIPSLESVMDNDPQGMATRFALAQCKPYYRGRPWWTELDELYTENGEYQAKLADAIEEESNEEYTTDLAWLQGYKLNYETVANVMGWPL